MSTTTISIIPRWMDRFASRITSTTGSITSMVGGDSWFQFMTTTMMSGSPMTSFPADYLLLQSQESQSHLWNLNVTSTTNVTTAQSLSPIPFPDWEYEIVKLQFYFVMASIVWWMVVPYYWMVVRRHQSRRRGDPSSNSTTTSTTGSASTTGTTTKNDTTTTTTTKPREQQFKNNKNSYYYYFLIVLPMTLGMIFLGWCLTMLLINTVASPYNNSITARRVFQTPLLTPTECQTIIQMSHAAAHQNVQQYQKYHPDDFTEEEELMLYEVPYGWQKLRHAKVPTTDLNLVTDPFAYEQQQYIVQRLGHVRIGPLLSRLYGIPIRSIQARDIFVVRYDGNSTSRFKLKKHTDGGDISFTIYLNTDFTGGGTQFWNRHTKQPFYLLPGGNGDTSTGSHESDSTTTTTTTTTSDMIQPGQFSTFPSIVEHEGYPTTEGIRYILVGFLDVVRYDEDGITPSGLSIYASYLNWNWMLARFTDAIEKWDWDTQKYYFDPKTIRKYTMKATSKVAKLLDRFTEHCMTAPLIRQEQLPELIQVLEESFHNTSNSAVKSRRSQRARWIEGQQKRAFVQYIDNYFDDDEEEEEEDDKYGIANVAKDEPVTSPTTATSSGSGIHPPDVVKNEL
jgi:hypothetical protein